MKESILGFFDKNKILLRIQLTILVISLFPLLFTSYTYQRNYERSMNEYYNVLNQSITDQVTVSIEAVVDNIVNMVNVFYEDKLLEAYMKAPSISDYDAFIYIERKAHQLLYANPYIESIYVYCKNSDQIYASNQGVLDAKTFRDLSFMDWYRDDPSSILISDTHHKQVFDWDRGKDVFSVCIRFPITLPDYSVGAIIVNIDQQSLYDGIIGKLVKHTNSKVFILSAENQVIITDVPELLYQDVSALDALVGEGVDLKYGALSPVKWRVAHMYSATMFDSYIAASRSAALLSFLLVTAVFLGLLLAVNLKTFRPIRDMSSLLSENNIVPQRELNRLDDVKSAVSSLLRDTHEMQQQTKKMFPVYKENLLRNLLYNRAYDIGMEDELSRFSIPSTAEDLVLAIFRAGVRDGRVHEQIANQVIIRTIVEDCLRARGSGAFVVENDDGDTVAVFAAADNLHQTMQILSDAQQLIAEHTQATVTIGLSYEPSTLRSLCAQHARALNALKCTLLFGEGEIIVYDEAYASPEGDYAYPQAISNRLITAIRQGDTDTALSELWAFIGEARRHQRYYFTQLSLINLNVLLLQMSQDSERDGGFFADNVPIFLERFATVATLEEITGYFQGIIRSLCDLFARRQHAKSDEYATRIITYVEQNYMNDISLDMLIDEVSLSSAAINHILKESTGKTFIQYLNTYRIEKACKLLETTQLKIQEIALASGYSTSKYFIQVFKAIMHMTPGEYRHKLKAGD